MNQPSAPKEQPDRLYPIARPSEWKPYLPLSASMVWKMASRGEIRLVPLGNRTFIPQSEITRLASAGSAS